MLKLQNLLKIYLFCIQKESFKDVKDIVNGMTITQCIEKLAKCKSKDYSSLTSKCIFKYMDMIGA